MEDYIAAFNYIQKIAQQDANGELFRLAFRSYEQLGRGTYSILFNNPFDVYESLGLSLAQYLPVEIAKIEDGEDVIEYCNNYDPTKQFVFTISIGQQNELEKPVIRNTFIVDYIGERAEKELKTKTVSLIELENRFKNKKIKSYRCDECGQRRLIKNLIFDPFIQRLIFCNETCMNKNLKEGGGESLITWYKKNQAKLEFLLNQNENQNNIKNQIKLITS